MQAIEIDNNIPTPKNKPFKYGLYQGQLKISDDFDEPLPDSFWLELAHNNLADRQNATDVHNAYKEFKASGKASISLDEMIKENSL
ncbi:MAG: hypothetical protein GQ582_09785 [Methyloprofundus sp.]|nr:hypothetical protein [Methyloprofundus sp.]